MYFFETLAILCASVQHQVGLVRLILEFFFKGHTKTIYHVIDSVETAFFIETVSDFRQSDVWFFLNHCFYLLMFAL